MKSTAARSGLRLGLGLIALAFAMTAGLTGCIQAPAGLPTGTPTDAASASAAPPAVPSVTPTPTAQKFAEDCNILLTAAQVYSYNPNYVVDPAYAPKPGMVAAEIAANQGQTCGWINETSGAELEVAIASPPASARDSAKSAASAGTPITASGAHGYFSVRNHVGSAQFFFGSFWLVVSSPGFEIATDAAALCQLVVRNQQTAVG